jgi:6-phosphogluconolactonase
MIGAASKAAPRGQLHVSPYREAQAQSAAQWIIEALNRAVKERGVARMALSREEDPMGLLGPLLKRQDEVDWPKVRLYWVDERWVPASHPRSNYGTAKRIFLSKLKTAPGLVAPMDTTLRTPEMAAADYNAKLAAEFDDAMPDFDVCVLGIGADGHTASLFPASPLLYESPGFCATARHPHDGDWRVTLTLPVINHSRLGLVFAQGPQKKAALDAARCGRPNDPSCPASFLHPTQLLWLLDRGAAGDDKP